MTDRHMSDDLAPVPDAALSQWDRYLRDPSVDVTKLQALFELWERAQKRQAEAAFNAAFSAMQGELPTIDENGRAVMPDGKVRYKHALLEDIVEAVKPILQKHGFALRFRHEYHDGMITIIGILSHRDGHSEQDQFACPADKSGSKNDIQAIGSTRTYGQRYTTRALLNIVSRDPNDPARDTDGHRVQPAAAPTKPAKFDEELADFEAKADEGWEALQTAWKRAKPEFRAALAQPQREALKQRAREADAKRQAATP